MQISIGIVGLPNVGKSTLFNAITKKQVPAENFPFCTIDPSVGVVRVPDERLIKLSELSKSEETIPAVIEFVDIAGLVRGASKGEGLGNAFLSHIRDVDAIAHVVRCFENEDITHVEGEIDPKRDIDIIETELILSDVVIAEKRIEKIVKDVRGGDKDRIEEDGLLKRALEVLNTGELLSSMSLTDDEIQTLRGLGFLTQKKIMYICNVGEKYNKESVEEVKELAKKRNATVLCISINTEMELSQLEPTEANMIRQELLEDEDGIDVIIKNAYKTLSLISFFTTGEKETRAWTIPKDSTAPRAGRAIHSDFETKFIRAEIVSYEQLIESGSLVVAKEKGILRLEGKEYIVQDGDVITFRHG